MTEEAASEETTADAIDQVVADAEATHAVVDPIEALAREKGWSPKEDWRGNPEEWRAPRDFIAFGMDRGREARREMRDLRSTVDRIANTAEGLQRRAVDEAVRDAEARFASAVENKDHDGARAARDELTQLQARPATPMVPAETADFMTRNAGWFNVDPDATRIAHATTDRLARLGHSPAEQLRQAEEAVRAAHPSLFGQRQASKPPAAVAPPDSRVAVAGKGPKGATDLPAEARRAGQDFVKRGMVKNLEDYARVYFEENA